jgi:hypothetical protein
MAVTAFSTTPYRDAFSLSNTPFFAGFDPNAVAAATPSIRPDPRYTMASGYQTRRAMMLQAKVSF